MAKVRAPFLGLDATGTLGDLLTASTWKGVKYMKLKPTPSQPRLPAQVGVRANFSMCVLTWQSLSPTDKALWETYISGNAQSGFNALVGTGQSNLAKLLGVQQLPTRVNNMAPAAPTAGAGEIVGTQITITWTDAADADNLLTYVHRSATTGFTVGRDNMIGGAMKGVEKFLDTPGAGTWYYKLRTCDVDGNLSVASTQITPA